MLSKRYRENKISPYEGEETMGDIDDLEIPREFSSIQECSSHRRSNYSISE